MSAHGLLYLSKDLKDDAVEMGAKTLVKCVKNTHVVDNDYKTAGGICYDLYHLGYDTKAGTYIYWLAQEVGFDVMNNALKSLINELKVVKKVDSNKLNQFVKFVEELGFTVEDPMMGIVG